MKFTLIWKQSAEDQLTEIWLSSDDRDSVTAATLEVDRLLSRDPDLQGESRSANERILVELPLIVTFEVNVDDRKVTIINVRGA